MKKLALLAVYKDSNLAIAIAAEHATFKNYAGMKVNYLLDDCTTTV